jgi:protein associated with RNAse G/E
VLFLDEPTIGLDVVAQQRVRAFLHELNQTQGTTIMLTSHDMGDILTVRVLHADGQCFRSWQSVVERISSDCVITRSAPGQTVDDLNGKWTLKDHIRAYYWLDRPYNLLEVYDADGAFIELYINVASVPTLDGHTLTWTDHELDISKLPGKSARIVDQDEFTAAAIKYGYSPEFQVRCHALSEALRQFAECWTLAVL